MGSLRALTVARVKRAGMYGDGGGLYLQVAAAGTRSWIFRYWVEQRDPSTGDYVRDPVSGKVRGRSREMGLGSFKIVSLEQARELAAECRRLRQQGIDPIEARRAMKVRSALNAAKSVTFAVCAENYIESHRHGWKSAKHANDWRFAVGNFANPVIGNLPVQAVDTALVMKVLEPVWREKPETASRLRGRIENILDWAKVRGYRTGENPARWRGHVDKLLPARSKVRKTVHHPALGYTALPDFMGALRPQSDNAARALQFTILTAARTGEVLSARWAEVDLANKTWTIPAARMKAGTEHRVPLSDAAIALLWSLAPNENDGLLFPGRDHRRLSSISMVRVLRRMGRADITVHGFRSTFRDWAAERTSYASQVCEMALAHAIRSRTESAYRRGDLFDKRRRLMDDWASFCSTPRPAANITPLRLAAE